MFKIDKIENIIYTQLIKATKKITRKLNTLLIYWGEASPDDVHYNIQGLRFPARGGIYIDYDFSNDSFQKNRIHTSDVCNEEKLYAYGGYYSKKYSDEKNNENDGELEFELFTYRISARLERKYKVPVITTIHDEESYFNPMLKAIALQSLNLSFTTYKKIVIQSHIPLRNFIAPIEQGLSSAKTNIGPMYVKGQGMFYDEKEAFQLFHKAAEQGDADAQFNIGVMYAKGRAVPQDYVQSYMWLTLARSQGVKDATLKQSIITKNMTAKQIADATRLAREWNPNK